MKRRTYLVSVLLILFLIAIFFGKTFYNHSAYKRVWCHLSHHSWARYYSVEDIWVYNFEAKDDRRPFGYKYSYLENSMRCMRCKTQLFNIHMQDFPEEPIAKGENSPTVDAGSLNNKILVIPVLKDSISRDSLRSISCANKDLVLNGVCEERDSRGNLLGRWNVKNDRMDGEAFFKRVNLSKFWEGSFKNGKLSEKSTTYRPNGEIKRIDSYRHGVADGLSVLYYEGGKVEWERNFSHGVRNGLTREFYPTGILKLEGTFERGSSILKHYDEAGELVGNVSVVNGLLTEI